MTGKLIWKSVDTCQVGLQILRVLITRLSQTNMYHNDNIQVLFNILGPTVQLFHQEGRIQDECSQGVCRWRWGRGPEGSYLSPRDYCIFFSLLLWGSGRLHFHDFLTLVFVRRGLDSVYGLINIFQIFESFLSFSLSLEQIMETVKRGSVVLQVRLKKKR